MANGLVAEERRLCPKEYMWSSDFGKCYKFSSDRITWRMANERCMLQDATLTAIESQREMYFITETARKAKGETSLLMRTFLFHFNLHEVAT